MGAYKEFQIPTAGSAPGGIAIGPDGNLWFTESYGNKIGSLTSAGVFREFPLGAAYRGPRGIAVGPDGALWFTEAGGGFGRIAPTGAVTEFSGSTGRLPASITAGPNGTLWFTGNYGLSAGRITTQGKVTVIRKQ